MQKIKCNYTHDDSVARVVLDDGKGNVLDHLMLEDLQQLLNEFKSKANLKLITFEGAGKHFSFGASIEEHKKEYAAVMLKQFHGLFFALRDLAIPTVAKISGQCLGGGMELALMCNFLFADKTAKMAQPEIILGVFPPPASILLPEKIGYARAEDILITGRSVDAEEAKNIGLLLEVFDDKSTMDTKVDEWINKNIVPKSASSLRYSVKATRVKLNHIIGNFLPALEQLYVQNLMNTKDANEGINSFIEKRKPVWSNN